MKKLVILSLALGLAVVASNCSSKMRIKTLPYPTTRVDSIVDDYHGTPVADPYRWLEDDNSAETAAWVEAQNAVTFDYLDQIPYRGKISARLSELWNYAKAGAPQRVGDRYFTSRNDGLQNQNVIYMADALGGEETVFLDPNTLSDDGTAALNTVTFSEDGRHIAYSVARAGSDWVEILVKEIPSGRQLSDSIRWVKFSGASWAADSKGFYYSGYDKPAPGSELSGQNQFQKIYYHELGTPQSADKLIYSDPAHPLRYLSGGDDGKEGKWLFVEASEGTYGTEILFREAASSAPFRPLLRGFDNNYFVVKTVGDTAYVFTNDGAPNYRLASIDLTNPATGLTDVIPTDPDRLLEGVEFAGGYIMALYLENATSKVYQYRMDGTEVREAILPGLGAAAGFDGKDADTAVFYELSTLTAPTSVYRYDLSTGESTLHFAPGVDFDPAEFVTEQVFFESKDGTRVPMFISHKKGIELDGNNPAYLYGYGGFSINITPRFSPANIAMMEQGTVYVEVNLRGGNEYGEQWHRAGMLENKQNVFDDFIAAAEWLIDNGYTSSEKLAIVGGSNGGLLVGACMTQRPDLYAVAFPAVGVLDMLRFHLFTVGWGWVVEYGSSENPEQFEYIYKYSPLHNITPGVCYPATMITTADHDDRVVPAHSFKFAAALQAAQGCDNPTLIRIDTNAGHGAGKPTAKRIADAADMLSFFFWNTETAYK